MDFYPDAGKEIPKGLPPEKETWVRMTAYVDGDHALDLVTRRSITGILVILNNTVYVDADHAHDLVTSRFITGILFC
jgi:hypothetical protein